MKCFLTYLFLCVVIACTLAMVSCKKDSRQYTITVTGDGNGTAVADPTTAVQGATVTLTAMPGEGYIFNKWTVVSGNAELSDATVNPATFIMPAGNVEVEAGFIIDPDTIEYVVTVTDDGNGTGTASATMAVRGTEITLTATADSGYMFGKWSVVSGNVELQDATANPATFTMPAENVEVKAEFDVYNGFKYIADPAFREYCAQFDSDENGYLSLQEAAAVTEISVIDMQLESLAGIEIFGNLTRLDCDENNLTSLDVSKNSALKFLSCNNNNLSALNVEGAVVLEYLFCDRNNLASLDVSGNTALLELYCGENELTALDINGAVALMWLTCDNNLFSADALKTLFAALPGRKLDDYAEVYCSENPGCTAITAEDIKVAKDKNWRINYL